MQSNKTKLFQNMLIFIAFSSSAILILIAANLIKTSYRISCISNKINQKFILSLVDVPSSSQKKKHLEEYFGIQNSFFSNQLGIKIELIEYYLPYHKVETNFSKKENTCYLRASDQKPKVLLFSPTKTWVITDHKRVFTDRYWQEAQLEDLPEIEIDHFPKVVENANAKSQAIISRELEDILSASTWVKQKLSESFPNTRSYWIWGRGLKVKNDKFTAILGTRDFDSRWKKARYLDTQSNENDGTIEYQVDFVQKAIVKKSL